MSLPILRILYASLFHQSYQHSNPEHRCCMQQIVFLLQETGIPGTSYEFQWTEQGVHSATLHEDLQHPSNHKPASNLSEEHRHLLKSLIQTIRSSSRTLYSLPQWIDCLASLHYLKYYVLPPSSSDADLLSHLSRIRPDLSFRKENRNALVLLYQLFPSSAPIHYQQLLVYPANSASFID